jgi:hypothetical protein
MRTIRPTAVAAILALSLGCAIAGCSGASTDSGSPVTASSGTGSPVVASSGTGSSVAATDPTDGGSTPASAGPTQTSSQNQAPGLLTYVPSSLAGDCTDNGTSGHLPAVSSYSDSLSCALGWDSPAEVDYYQYDSVSDMETAFNSAAASDYFDSPQQPGGCTGGRDEYGTWLAGGPVIGDIACPINNNNGIDLIWDDPNTKIIAVASADYVLPADLYSWWQTDGASIDGSTQSASSS